MKPTMMFLLLMGATIYVNGQAKKSVKKPATKTVSSKFGALAIDRSNGFYYGFSYDYANRAEAETKAKEECAKKGGNCSVVLTFSGTGCAAYRTIDGKAGTAYGWGIAGTKEEADAIALAEAQKRSNGVNPSNFVWSCNSVNTGTLKEIYNAKDEIIPTIKIGNQEWAANDLDVTKFKNGDKIPYAATYEEWRAAADAKKPAYSIVNSRKVYNGYALHDKRGLAPKGFHIPTDEEFMKLMNHLGGIEVAGGKMKSVQGWNSPNDASNSSKFTGLPGGGRGTVNDKHEKFITHEGGWWSSTFAPNGNTYVYIIHHSRGSVFRTAHGYPWGYNIRLIKD
ncbi:FISUMP domain-containing protein [Chryseobacterium oryctis]|uniref:DUF4189 domain-containing protein n=1 Tax=Chryseobacterium oryctis TaxID=2952618 RepID=A0ABT3HK03_9FLAO|nr:FISUMP domain-containing protein [Chryseobacterium oryctis]MCW3160119.1 DUF4189 domain-containing protein [Chryseobacterium oryctis]